MSDLTQSETFELIKKLRDERYDVDEVYIGGNDDPVDIPEEVIVVEEDLYIPQRFREEDHSDIAQEIFEIADSTILAHLMDTADDAVPVYSMKKNLGPQADIQLLEWDAVSDIMEHVDLMELSSLMHRNWGAFDQMVSDEIIAGISVFYPDNDPGIIEAAIYSLLFAVQAERAA